MAGRPRVVIVGGGFGGLAAARALRGADASVTLVDRKNHHLFQPLLYQVATGELSPANIASPLRAILSRQDNCRVVLDEVTGFDVERRLVVTRTGELLYDSLVVAAGARHGYFGHDEWERFAPGLKTLEDATEMRRRVLFAFEAAEREEDPARVAEWLTFVIVGGGPTGVELAGALSETAYHTLRRDFRRIDPTEARILLVEAGPRILSTYPGELSARARRSLERLSVTVLTGSAVTAIHADRVELEGEDRTEVRTRTVLWSAGVAASPLGRRLAEALSLDTDRSGRVPVTADLTVAGHPEIFVVGDLARCADPEGTPLPGVAPVAVQQGRHAGAAIRARLRGGSVAAFRYRDRGSMAVIGRYRAIALIGRAKLSGFLAWLAWLFVHLMEITQYRNRVLVLVQWGWSFLTRDRSARLITDRDDARRTSQNSVPSPPAPGEPSR